MMSRTLLTHRGKKKEKITSKKVEEKGGRGKRGAVQHSLLSSSISAGERKRGGEGIFLFTSTQQKGKEGEIRSSKDEPKDAPSFRVSGGKERKRKFRCLYAPGKN